MLYTTSASNRKTRRRRRSPNFPVFAIWAALVATDAFLQSHTQATLPPAASIAALAPAVAPTPLSLTALVREPLLMTFTTLANSPTTPAQAALQRHLTAFKTNLMVATGTRLLTLVTTASGLAQAGADTTAYAALGMLGAVCGLDAIEFHDLSLRGL